MLDEAAGPTRIHVEAEAVSKDFGGTRALDDVSLLIAEGTVHALVGENGAGKSTLGKLVSGVLPPSRGRVLVHGEPVTFRSPRDALEHGIASIAQEPTVVPGLTVAENVLLGVEPRSIGLVQRRKLRRQYAELAASAGFDLAADRPAMTLRTAELQELEILRALSRNAGLIVMDEPSAALSLPETEKLHDIVRSLARAGKTVLFVSHSLPEILALADTVTVLRDGRVVRTAPAAEETEQSLIEAMLGRPVVLQFPSKRLPPAEASVALAVRGLHGEGFEDVSFEIRRGEILGLAGLVGAGRTELARAIFGADRIVTGQVELSGARVASGSPRRSLADGVAMIPESRKDEGLVLSRPVVENVSLASLRALERLGFVRRRLEQRVAGDVLTRVDVRARRNARTASLSGGNQQKVLFARSLLSRPSLLIADEPTRGVDVGAKREIYELLASLAEEGMAVLFISSEIEEILGLAHRVLVIRGGRIAAELRGADMTESAVLNAAFAAGPSIRKDA